MTKNSLHQQLIVEGPTTDELRASCVPDICLDVLVAEMSDGPGQHYTVTYYPHDVHGAYVSVSSGATSTNSKMVVNAARLIAAACHGCVDERGIAAGHPEEIVHFPDERIHMDIAETIDACCTYFSEVRLVRAEYGRVPQEVYEWTGFAPEKLRWL